MAPTLRPRQSLSAERFPVYFSKMQPQNYPDLSRDSRAPSSSNQVRCLAWNCLGQLIATGSSDKTLRVWNPDKPQGKFSTELKGHSAAIEKVAFNPVKDAELCSVSSDGVVKFWDVRTKNCFNEVKGLGDAFTLAWAPDGQTLIVGNKADNIFVLSPTSPTVISSHQQSTHTNQISFCWSGDKVFVTTAEGKIRILSYPDFEPILREQYDDEREAMLSGHTSSCLSAELQPIGRYLATGGSDSIIELWDTKDWLCKRTITSMTGPVRSLSWTFDGSFIVGGSDEGNGLVVTHAETGEKVHTFNTVGACPLVAWAPTRYWLAYNDMGSLKIVGVDVDKLDRR
ncbi:WD40-repeat-containing domain protein [Emericellopsis atlantica]|uniref:WD40-repeat-containing domain protein n=1 Tax=Emericellopsis atlantica TaxID=2614577 RepID=A0A9P7ZMU6_9HYPO|nr:WD40-repeat-containing domain protein [Emericellopsis atlantica]KAG9255023.1 WD40-repeat-containing domain protein [Emericellopsis atlantica]